MKKPGTTKGKKRTVAKDLSVWASSQRLIPLTTPGFNGTRLETNCLAAVYGRHTLLVSLPPVRDGESGRKSSVSPHTHQASVEDAEKGEHE